MYFSFTYSDLAHIKRFRFPRSIFQPSDMGGWWFSPQFLAPACYRFVINWNHAAG